VSRVHLLVISGPAGVGKSTTGWEVSAQLETAGVAHAILDGDELDRVVPVPAGVNARAELCRRNLAGLWSNFAALGHNRLIVAGVFVDLPADLAWIRAAVPGASIVTVRLLASAATLRKRLDRREIGPGKADQMARTLDQAARIWAQSEPGVAVIDTDDRSVTEVAALVLARSGWVPQ
jgi:predicted kinase